MSKKSLFVAFAAAVIVVWTRWGQASEPPIAPRVEATPGQRLPGKYVGFEPVVAADGEGRVVAAAIDHHSHRILVWTSADRGKTFALPHPTLLPPEALQNEGDPLLQAVGGQFFLTLMAQQPKKRGMDGYLLRSADGGKAWKKVHTFSGGKGDVDRPLCAFSPNGRRAAYFCTGRIEAMFSSDGAATWTPAPSAVLPSNKSGNPYGIAINDDGRAILSYVDRDKNLELAVTRDGGKTWRRHRFGSQTEKGRIPTAEEEEAGVTMWASGVALAQDDEGTVHALSAQRAEKGESIDVWYRSSQDGDSWSKPMQLSSSRAAIKAHPAIASAGKRVHAIWLECEERWCRVCYRGSLDGGKTWSEPITVSKPERPSELMTKKGFRTFSGHYMGVAEDGRGITHIVWGVMKRGLLKEGEGEIWHASVHLLGKVQGKLPQ
ncbi:MAG TPA: sialidase family protein [Gemmataceae bacterium]|nr:sialidase family protein [Gemmataceae bacterium]